MIIDVIHDDVVAQSKVARFTETVVDVLNIDIDCLTVRFTPELNGGAIAKSEGVTFGEVVQVNGLYEVLVNSEINSKSQAVTIAHELIHVEQMESGRLEQLDDGFMWLGEFYPSSTPYDQRPWEAEARGNEVALTNQVLSLL